MVKQKEEAAKEILDSIKNAIEFYNRLDMGNKISLVNDTNDVSDVFICVYNTGGDNHVGLFREKKYCAESEFFMGNYDAGSVFLGVNSNYVGIRKTREGDMYCDSSIPGLMASVDGETYVSNCSISEIISFDDMRLIMYGNRLIPPYVLGKAFAKDLVDVLAYASDYYKLEQSAPAVRGR